MIAVYVPGCRILAGKTRVIKEASTSVAIDQEENFFHCLVPPSVEFSLIQNLLDQLCVNTVYTFALRFQQCREAIVIDLARYSLAGEKNLSDCFGSKELLVPRGNMKPVFDICCCFFFCETFQGIAVTKALIKRLISGCLHACSQGELAKKNYCNRRASIEIRVGEKWNVLKGGAIQKLRLVDKCGAPHLS